MARYLNRLIIVNFECNRTWIDIEFISGPDTRAILLTLVGFVWPGVRYPSDALYLCLAQVAVDTSVLSVAENLLLGFS